MADMPEKHADNFSLAGAVNTLGELELQMTMTNWGNALKQANKTEDNAYKKHGWKLCLYSSNSDMNDRVFCECLRKRILGVPQITRHEGLSSEGI